MNWPVDDQMKALLAQARANGQWLRNRFHNLNFSPTELEKLQEEGRFRWGVASWELADPMDIIRQKFSDMSSRVSEIADLLKRMQ